MRRPVSFYDRATGEFTRARTIDFGRQPILAHPNEDWMHGRFDPTSCRIDPETLEVVALHDFAPVVQGNKVSGLPEGTKAVYHLRKAMIGADGVLQVNVTYEQAIAVHLTRALYNHMELTLHCTPQGNAPGGHDLPQRYDRLRMAAYPPLGDLADAIAKGDDAALTEYQARCRAVKDRFPKPGRTDT